ncbi:unnamed protein product [Rotaria sp. Silwood1]|nr:unnamed protein product [Rotaria sp. Silwood1]
MTSTNDVGLASERIQNATEVDLNEVTCSTICENILWKPLSCQQCETHFCSMCIRQWLDKHPNECPMRCTSFIERPCSKFIARQLAKLKVVCIYRTYGCQEVIPYEALEKHEITCGNQLVKCIRCQLDVPRKNLAQHQPVCQQTTAMSLDRNMVHVTCQNDSKKSNSEIAALKAEVQLLRQALINDLLFLDQQKIKRAELKSTIQLDVLLRNRVVLDSASPFADNVICSVCGNVFWKPVSCKNCSTVFCMKCRPTGGILGKISSFFKIQQKFHGKNGCEDFEETQISSQVIHELAKLRVRCAYASNGCRVLLFYYELEQHERVCEFESIPCELCQYPLSKRSPMAEHTRRACFEYMRNKNPSGIQQQLMILYNAFEESQAENRRLQLTITQMQKEFRDLNAACVRKDSKTSKK